MAKATLKDIAREAGVSQATVSYVLNNTQNQKISEEVRNKVIQISHLLGYTKNFHANALATGRSNHVGLYLSNKGFTLAKAEVLLFVNSIAESLKKAGFDSVLIPHDSYKHIDYLDAIICVCVDDEEFKNVCSSNYIPVLALDSKAHEPWIFEISTIFKDIKNTTTSDNYYLVIYNPLSLELKKQIIEENPRTICISSFDDFNEVLEKSKDSQIITPFQEIFDYLKKDVSNLIKYRIDVTTKFSTLIQCLNDAINHKEAETHVFNIE